MHWLHDHVRTPKGPEYAARALARIRLGMKARGEIRGVRILTGSDSCAACRAVAERVYLPDEAPIIPVAGCSHPAGCRCAYTPVMTYETAGADSADPGEG